MYRSIIFLLCLYSINENLVDTDTLNPIPISGLKLNLEGEGD